MRDEEREEWGGENGGESKGGEEKEPLLARPVGLDLLLETGQYHHT